MTEKKKKKKPAMDREALHAKALMLIGDAVGRIANCPLSDMEVATSPRLVMDTDMGKMSVVARKSWNDHWFFVLRAGRKQAEGLAYGKKAAVDKCLADLDRKMGFTDKEARS